MVLKLVCPTCCGVLQEVESLVKCESCSHEYRVIDGCVDFVGSSTNREEELQFYNQRYEKFESSFFPERLEYEIEEIWRDRLFPSCQDILKALADLDNKSTLCLGNGSSLKELYFAKRGANVCISDLSLSAILRTKRIASREIDCGSISFHAIDALHLPFADSSLDVVYGYAFVHHLADKVSFLEEAFRVLKGNGVCVFFDDSYSWLWHTLKMRFMRPLRNYSHKRSGISPQDYRASMAGGFKEQEIQAWGLEAGFSGEYFYIKHELLTYLWLRGMEKLLRLGPRNMIVRLVGSFLSNIDDVGGRFAQYRKNMVRIVWGFKK